MVKNLVRLALAREHSRNVIKRDDINNKVLNKQSRSFKNVFDAAQLALRSTFGMEMVELPAKEKVTLKDKRAAQKSQSQGTTASSKQWLLCSVLPADYRDADVISPAKAPAKDFESAYTGLYSFIVTVIALSGGRLPEARLERILARMNADQNTPVANKEDLFKRMVKQDYIGKVVEQQGGENVIDYIVGPRGRLQVGNEGVAGLVRRVYAHSEGGEAQEELERRLARSLKVAQLDPEPPQENRGASAISGPQISGTGKRGRLRRHQQQPDGDDEE